MATSTPAFNGLGPPIHASSPKVGPRARPQSSSEPSPNQPELLPEENYGKIFKAFFLIYIMEHCSNIKKCLVSRLQYK